MCMVIVCLIVEFPTFELPKKSKSGYPNFPLDLLFMYFFKHLGGHTLVLPEVKVSALCIVALPRYWVLLR